MKKTILITGSTDGIGKLAAIKLAEEGHKVYLHGRNAQKLAALVTEIRSTSHNEEVDGFTADFSDLQAVQHMATEVTEKLSSLDVLINNAGIFNSKPLVNQEGMDIRYVVNYLAPWVLTEALLPMLEKGTDPRLINLSSAAQAPVSYDILQGKSTGSERATYAQSKLALTMWSFHLAKKYPTLSVVALNPGSLLNTNMVREAFGHHWSSADKGANIIHELAVSDKHEGITGKYYDNDQGSYGQAHADAYDAQEVEKLIQTTKSLLAT